MNYLKKIQALSKTKLPKLKLKEGGDLEKVGLIKVGTKNYTFAEFAQATNLKVPGNLDLSGTKITKLPAGFQDYPSWWLPPLEPLANRLLADVEPYADIFQGHARRTQVLDLL